MSYDPDLDRFYGNLRNYVRMVVHDYSNLLLLDAKGGLGKTHNVCEVLDEEMDEDEWLHHRGFTTPIELFKTLWRARHEDAVLFLDDMSGISGNSKALDMLKSATDTQGEENWVEYRTSRDIDHPFIDGRTLPNQFCFRGTIIMSFNETPDSDSFRAFRDRGIDYQLSFTYPERIELITEIAKVEDFTELTVSEQRETAEWVETVTDSSFDVTIRTFEEVCKMRQFGQDMSKDWQDMALEVFDLNPKKHRIIQLREADEMPVEQQVEVWCEEYGMSESHYYDLLSEIKDERGD
jgi:hypothetical protein